MVRSSSMLRLALVLVISTLVVSADGGTLSRNQLVRESQLQAATARAATRPQTTQPSFVALVADVATLPGGTGVPDSATRPMSIVDLATGILNAQASDINDKGEVVGFTVSNDQLLRGFLWRGASVIDLPTVGGSWAQPMAINNLGQVVGSGPVGPGGQGEHHGYLWQDGAMIETGVAGCAVVPSDINNRSQVVGSLWCEGNRMGFLWQDGQLTTLELDTDYGFAEGLNDQGEIVGARRTVTGAMHAFRMVDGVTTDLPPLDLASNHSEAQDINESGVVVGNSLSAAYWSRAVRWTDDAVQDLWTGDPLTHSSALAVNDAGDMAGYVVLNRGGGPTQAVAWGKGGIKSLETLGGEGTHATDVNSAGIVSGAAQDPSGAWHAVLWVDYPSLVKMTEALVEDGGVRTALVSLLHGALRAGAADNIRLEASLLAAYGRLLQTEASSGVSEDDAATLIFLSKALSTAPTQVPTPTPTPLPTPSPFPTPTPTPFPTPSPTPTPTPTLPIPVLALLGTDDYFDAFGDPYTRYRLSVTNWDQYPSALFAASPDLPPCGLNQNASRTWVDIWNAADSARIYGFCGLTTPVDLTEIWFAIPRGTVPPEGVYVTLIDRLTGQVVTSNTVSVTSVVDQMQDGAFYSTALSLMSSYAARLVDRQIRTRTD